MAANHCYSDLCGVMFHLCLMSALTHSDDLCGGGQRIQQGENVNCRMRGFHPVCSDLVGSFTSLMRLYNLKIQSNFKLLSTLAVFRQKLTRRLNKLELCQLVISQFLHYTGYDVLCDHKGVKARDSCFLMNKIRTSYCCVMLSTSIPFCFLVLRN